MFCANGGSYGSEVLSIALWACGGRIAHLQMRSVRVELFDSAAQCFVQVGPVACASGVEFCDILEHFMMGRQAQLECPSTRCLQLGMRNDKFSFLTARCGVLCKLGASMVCSSKAAV